MEVRFSEILPLRGDEEKKPLNNKKEPKMTAGKNTAPRRGFFAHSMQKMGTRERPEI